MAARRILIPKLRQRSQPAKEPTRLTKKPSLAPAKKPSPRGPSRLKKRPSSPSAKDEAKRVRLKELTKKVLAAKTAMGANAYTIGSLLKEVQTRELHVAGGHRSFDAYLEAVSVPRRSAYRFMAIATSFDRSTVEAHTSNKLEAALHYSRAAGLDLVGKALLDAKVSLERGAGSGKVVTVRAASARELRDATLSLHLNLGILKTMESRASALEDALPEAPRGLRQKNRVRLTRGKDGTLAVSFAAIPVAEIEEFLEAVREHLGS